ncbi:hypothetical protein [Halosimplex pelagicum]|uniref:Uncharacterized protein n=1 Tax=Halosimplex pelagicum TaxID=869886 RepID=A0A7D5P986_9EURY|nr:hypothetical protein [Halosimplex pelagicum]QLH80602.1 hypothetical protein HZS54_02685 [Halosimplex pelagicum]
MIANWQWLVLRTTPPRSWGWLWLLLAVSVSAVLLYGLWRLSTVETAT